MSGGVWQAVDATSVAMVVGCVVTTTIIIAVGWLYGRRVGLDGIGLVLLAGLSLATDPR
jgi:hypothetical protein